MKELYCIACEEMVHLEEGLVFGHLIYIPTYYECGCVEGVDTDLCEFPTGYTFVAPPPVEPDWIDSVVEQGSNELEVDLDSLEPDYTFEVPQLVEV